VTRTRRLFLLSVSGVVGLGAILALAVFVGGSHLLQRMEGRRLERESHSMVEAVRKVARLSTVEMNVSTYELRRDARNLFGFLPIKCEKTVAVFFRGKVAAGFDLTPKEALAVSVTSSGSRRRLVVDLPPPQLLYTDAPAPEVLVADGSICNRLEAADYQKLNAEARTALQKQAIDAGILGQAERHARELVNSIAAPFGFETEVRVRPAAAGGLSVSRAD
jgi:hypothetical protein